MGTVNTSEERVELTAIDKVSAVFEKIEDRSKRLGKAYDSLKATFIIGTVAVGAYEFYDKLKEAQLKSEVSSNRLIAVLRATGEAAGFSKQELEDYARSLSESTQFGAAALKAAESNLLKFGNIHGDVFKEALKLSADYAAFTGGDVADATQAIGKALAAPLEGTRALEREIGKLNFTTKERIETLLHEGRVTEAQNVVLDVLRSKIGGTAEVMNTGLLRATTEVDKAWYDLLKTTAGTGTWNVGLEVTRDLLRDVEKALRGSKNALEDFLNEQLVARVPGAAAGQLLGQLFFRNGNGGPTARGRIQYPAGTGPADLASQALVGAAQQAEAADRIREAWTKALPVVDSWNLRLLQMNGATEEEIARLQVLDRTVTKDGMQFTVRAPHGDLPSGAKVDVLNTALELDRRRQKAFAIDTELRNFEDLSRRMSEVELAERSLIVSWSEGNRTLAFQTSLLGKTTYAQEQLTAAHQIDLQVEENLKQAATLYGEDASAFSAYSDKVKAAAEVQKAKLLELLEVRRQIERDWTTGAKSAFGEYAESAGNAAKNAHDFFTNGFQAMEDALVNFVKTGKLDFRSFADSVISDIIRIQIRQGITAPLAGYANAAISSVGAGVAGLFGFAEGGVMTAAGPLPLRRYAGGGIASGPQLAMFGEGSMPEAYVPLPDGRSIPVQMRGSGGDTYVIDARGADRSGLARLEAMIQSVNGSLESRAVSALQRRLARRGYNLPV